MARTVDPDSIFIVTEWDVFDDGPKLVAAAYPGDALEAVTRADKMADTGDKNPYASWDMAVFACPRALQLDAALEKPVHITGQESLIGWKPNGVRTSSAGVRKVFFLATVNRKNQRPFMDIISVGIATDIRRMQAIAGRVAGLGPEVRLYSADVGVFSRKKLKLMEEY